MPDLSPTTFKPILLKLIKSPQDFGAADIGLALDHVITPGATLPEQVGAFLTGLAVARVELREEFIIAAAAFIYSRAIPAVVSDADKGPIVDIHGSRASTSSSGSADLLQALAPSPIPDIPFVFILAPHYHPALATLAPARRALPFRTLFNVLGPLLNPTRPRGMVLGVAEPALGPPFVAALKSGGVKRAYVVCGAEGLDEISCAGATHVWELLENGDVRERTLCPADFGLPAHPLSDVKSATPADNAAAFEALLTSGDNIPEHLTPILDFVLMNAAALLVVAGRAENFVDGVRLARESVTSGKAWHALEVFREYGVKESAEAELRT
ncbi:glycosyl transferase [Lactifluus subvellereus]|nr:glycosyl transferase [Lactifluus subvellereus]